MRRRFLLGFCTAIFIAALGAFLAILAGCGGSNSTTSPPPPVPFSQKIKHVVVIFQENRTPDNLFHGLPNADIADTGMNSAGQVIPLTAVPLANNYDLSHAIGPS
jgi:phospholipase C